MVKTILLKFGNNMYQYVSKIRSKFHIEIMSNKKVTAYQIAIPLDFLKLQLIA